MPIGTQCFFLGWDVGAWYCDKNAESRDTLSILNSSGQPIGNFWRGSLRELLQKCSGADEISFEMLRLCKIPSLPDNPFVTVAIDTPLGFSRAFVNLVAKQEITDIADEYAHNTYLFRQTERSLVDRGFRIPLSAVNSQIGSQATKGIHFRAKYAPILEAPGVWTDGKCLRVIETYPSPAREDPQVSEVVRQFPDPPPKPKSAQKDIEDSRCCAAIAYIFNTRPSDLFPPPASLTPEEGWIWVPR